MSGLNAWLKDPTDMLDDSDPFMNSQGMYPIFCFFFLKTRVNHILTLNLYFIQIIPCPFCRHPATICFLPRTLSSRNLSSLQTALRPQSLPIPTTIEGAALNHTIRLIISPIAPQTPRWPRTSLRLALALITRLVPSILAIAAHRLSIPLAFSIKWG